MTLWLKFLGVLLIKFALCDFVCNSTNVGKPCEGVTGAICSRSDARNRAPLFFCQYSNVCKDVTTNGSKCGRVGANKSCFSGVCGDLRPLPGSFDDFVQNRSGIVHEDAAVLRVQYNVGEKISVADVNGDQWPDLIVTGNSRTVFFFGRPNFSSFTLLYNASNVSASVGALVSHPVSDVRAAGDVNGDGMDDLLLNHTALVYGSKDFTQTFQDVAVGNSSTNRNGSVAFRTPTVGANGQPAGSMTAVGDINGDGFADLVYAGSFMNGSTSWTWGAFLLYGSASLNATIDVASASAVRFVVDNPPVACAWSFAAAGDADQDKFDDFFASLTCANASADRPNVGAIYLVYGASQLPATIQLESLSSTKLASKFVGALAGDRIGSAVDGGVDFNADGFNDIVIGAQTSNYSRGAVYVVFGWRERFASVIDLASLGTSQLYVVRGIEPYGSFGQSVSFGDVDSDGVVDVLTNAPFTYNSKHPGTFYALFGSAGVRDRGLRDVTQLDPSEYVAIHCDVTLSLLHSAAVVGDINGDGLNDWYVTAPSPYRGARTFVVFGRPQSLMRNHTVAFATNPPIVGPFEFRHRMPCDCPCGVQGLNPCPYCANLSIVDIQYYNGSCQCVQCLPIWMMTTTTTPTSNQPTTTSTATPTPTTTSTATTPTPTTNLSSPLSMMLTTLTSATATDISSSPPVPSMASIIIIITLIWLF